MKKFNELFEMYNNGDENIYLELFAGVDFSELYSECDKYLAKYEQFKRWLKYSEDYYNKKMAEITAFLEED